MTLESDERDILVRDRLEKSAEKLSTARDIVENHPNDSIAFSTSPLTLAEG
ncbi:hypothetical protein FACS1894187_02770 [Synergistales bacterium]|nr:hypothetical protein FACS1894187_02770 [Synergistales bacterium]